MADDPLERSHDKPMYGERRKQAPALLAVLGLIVAVVVVFAIITLLRYTT